MDSFTPRSVISGRTTATKGRAQEAAHRAAAAVLGSERIAVVYTAVNEDVWYLATYASDLASHSPSATPLSAALPGAAGHQGDGAYTIPLDATLQAIVIKKGEKLLSFVGTPVMASRFAVLEGVTVTHVCEGAKGMPWKLLSEVGSGGVARLQKAVTFSGLTVSVITVSIWLWAAAEVKEGKQQLESLRTAQVAAMKSAAHALASPAYPRALANLQKAVEQSAKEGGTLVDFEHKDGRSTWTLNVNNQLVKGGAN